MVRFVIFGSLSPEIYRSEDTKLEVCPPKFNSINSVKAGRQQGGGYGANGTMGRMGRMGRMGQRKSVIPFSAFLIV